MPVPTPAVEYHDVLPMLIVFGVAAAGVLVEAVCPRRLRFSTHMSLSVVGLVAAFVAVVTLAGTRTIVVMGSVAVDGPTLFCQGTILALSLLAVLLFSDRATVVRTEVFPLLMFAVSGLLLFPASADLLTMFIALEVFSLPLYVMCGLALRRRLLSQEAALKYFLLGAFSSALFLYGAALLYGYSGTLSLAGIGTAVANGGGDTGVAAMGLGLVAVGLLFKVGAVPFHSWVPDVYQGAPTPVTAFMAAATKVAAFGALLRIVSVAVPTLSADWRPVLSAVAVATMLIGGLMAVTQTDVKRLLAYSAVAQAGFLLLGVVAGSDGGVTSMLFYLAVYGVTVVGAFAVVGLVSDGTDGDTARIESFAGLAHRSPVLAALFSVFLLALAGIPLTSGFVGKFAVFRAALVGGAVTLVVVGVLVSAVMAFVYIRIIKVMFFAEPPADTARPAQPAAPVAMAIGAAAVVTVALGVLPQSLLDIAGSASTFAR